MPGLLTVTSSAASSRLTTVPAAKDDLGITATDDDLFIGRLIDRASAVVVAYCGRTFGSQGYQEIFRFGWEPGIGPAAMTAAPYGTPINVQRKPIILQASPVTAFASIVEGTGTPLVEGTDFEADYPAGLAWRLREGIRSWWNVPTVTVAYAAGWALPNDQNRTLPSDVEDVCLALVRSAYTARGRDPNVALDWTEGLGRTQYWDRSVGAMALDEALRTQLSPYVVREW